MADVYVVMRGFKDVKLRYVVKPTTKIPNADFGNFVPLKTTFELVDAEIENGYQDALRVIEDHKQ